MLYFTQSRGNTTGLQVEELLGSLFLGAPYDPNEESPPLDPYLGYYYEGEGDVYRAIVLDGDDLALEILGRGVVPLDYAGGERWKFRPNPSNVIAFDRGPDGSVSGYHIGDHQEFRLVPSPDLPTAQDLAARVRAAHRLDLLESAGPLRMTGTIEVEVAGLTGSTSETLAWPGRYRFEATTPQSFEVQTLHDGHAFAASTLRAAAELTGDAAHWARTASPLARFGSWADWYPLLEVIQELRGPNGESVFLVRTGDARAPARTLYVHGESGRVFREDGMTYADTLGRIGLRIEFDDFRDVGGMLLPFETRTTFPHPLIGTVVTTVTESALGVEVEASAFVLAD